jgi:peptide/nickel transport system permease protein
MINYIIRRLSMAALVLVIVSLLVFFAMRLLPGDPIRMLVTASTRQSYSEEQINQLRQEAGLDRPMIVQYVTWVSNFVRGDMGKSILSKTPVSRDIVNRLPITLHIGLTAFVIGMVLGIPAGIICAMRRGKWIDTVVTTLSSIGITIPTFWLGVMMIYLFGLQLKWLPVMGYTSPFTDLSLNARQMIMPVICEALFPLAANARQTRSSMLEVMKQDYIRTAWSKGLRERVIILRHALKNSLIPIITLSGMGLSMIIGGSVIIEQVFNIPGMGRLAITSILNQDYPYVQAITMITATAILLVNLFVDLTYGWFDPRIRYN